MPTGIWRGEREKLWCRCYRLSLYEHYDFA